MTSTVSTLSPAKIFVNGHNPRGEIDTSSEAFLEFKASIELRGILQPVLVGPAGKDGKHPLIAGHRRFTAACELGLDEIPVLERDPNGEEALLALVENVQREDLSPVEEANALDRMRKDFGMTQVDAAKALGKSERWARERLRLVDLPEKTKAAFDSGAIPLEAVGDVQKVAEKAPDVLEAIAEEASSGDENAPDLDFTRTEHLVQAIDNAIKEGEGGCMVKPTQVSYNAVAGAGIPAKVLEDFKKRFKKLVDTHPYYHSGTVDLDDKDIDAARAFGCLLELEGRNRWGEKETVRYITDAEWLVDRLDEVLAAEIKVAEKERASYRKMTSSSSSKAEKKDDSAAAKEKRRKERQAEQQERVIRREVNLELGRRSADVYQAPKFSLEEAKLFALMVVGPYCDEAANAGLVYCDPAFQEVEEKKNGAVKVTYGAGKPAGQTVLKAIKEAVEPEEALGIALRVVLLTQVVDRDVVAPSSQVVWRHQPGGAYHYGTSLGLNELMRTIAADRGLIAADIRQDLDRAARAQALAPEVEVLSTVAKCRAKAGLSIENNPILNAALELELAVVSDALAKKHLKENAADEGAFTYTITAAGKKRLEKVKAELKGLQAAK